MVSYKEQVIEGEILLKAALVVATYNGEKVIKKCVESLLRTEYDNKEVIVVVDGSTDSTPHILAEFGHKITVLKNNRGGVGSSRNVALTFTDADFIATTDDDCEVQPDWIKTAIDYFKNPKVGAVTGEKIYRITNTLSCVRSMEYHTRFMRRGREANSVECPVVLFRREALLKVGGFTSWSKVGGEDTDIGYKIKEAGYKIIYEPKMIIYHDTEASFKLYTLRNYRNARAYVSVFWTRSKKESLTDDFFPTLLKLQPFIMIGFIISLPALFFSPLSAVCCCLFALGMLINFLPVIKEVYKVKGVSSIPTTIGCLLWRNVVWAAGFFRGIIRLVKNKH